MQFTNRAVTAALLLAGLAPIASFALMFTAERMDAERAFRTALDQATAEYQRTRSLPALKRRYDAQIRAESVRIPPLMRAKRSLRLQLAALHASLTEIEHRYNLSAQDATPAWFTESGSIPAAFRYVERTEPVLGGASTGAPFFRRVVVASLGEVLEEDLRGGMLRGILIAMAQVEQRRSELTSMEARHRVLASETLTSIKSLEQATRGLAATEVQLERIQQTTQEVHEQVLAMQGALARIDAKIRARIERELLEKGLLTPGTIDRSAILVAPQFARPAYGPFSARFMDPDYRQYFGIPHLGLDIVIGQGSPVFSAADGIVFLARDGGATGFSYVLVGHRGGYATLYGHLSKITVTTGQDLRQGDAVGLSGGAVGAHGSGPTTTGPHLHFEVIKDGTNIDPQGALP